MRIRILAGIVATCLVPYTATAHDISYVEALGNRYIVATVHTGAPETLEWLRGCLRRPSRCYISMGSTEGADIEVWTETNGLPGLQREASAEAPADQRDCAVGLRAVEDPLVDCGLTE